MMTLLFLGEKCSIFQYISIAQSKAFKVDGYSIVKTIYSCILRDCFSKIAARSKFSVEDKLTS